MENQTIEYKGFFIEAQPYELPNSKGWTTKITITRPTVREVHMRSFSAKNIFKTKDEALRHCYEFGRKIIDGKIPGCSVADL